MRIAFIGKMRSGKDTAATFIKSEYGGEVLKFADPLYEMMKSVYSIARLPYQKDRRFLQLIGTEWGRNINENLWVDLFEKRVEEVSEKISNIYCTDVRFPNELERIQKLEFITIKIISPDEFCKERGATNTSHESERYIDELKADVIIENNGTLEDFKRKLFKVMDSILTEKI